MEQRVKSITILLITWFLPCTLVSAQTPFDAFSPETSRIILDGDSIAAWRAEQQSQLSHHHPKHSRPDTILCALIADLRNEQLLLVDIATHRPVAAAPFTDEIKNWLSVDPLVDKNIVNSPYMYCSGNPIVRIDPDGRADYYDIDGNHLCNDGVDDKKVFQQSELGERVLGGYAIPFKEIGNVDKISLSYVGEMVDGKNQSSGQLVVTQHVGDKTFSKSYSAVSGSNSLYTLQNGDYTCYDYDPNDRRQGFVRDNIGFGIRLKPAGGWTTQRNGLMIHPDGNKPGTAGCIGLTGTASELSLFQKMVSPFVSSGNIAPLTVFIPDNPQCCRAIDRNKGWFEPLFCK